MLTVVIRDWLESLKNERDLDAPLIALLAAVGYTDIHLTHGRNEIGKDIIAKGVSNGIYLQFAFQTKLGDLNTRRWDDEIRNQMDKAVTLGLQHPQWNSEMPRKGVLVITGRIGDGVQGQVQLFNDELVRRGYLPIEVWAMERLVEEFANTDPTSVYRADARGITGYGDFFRVYGEALSGHLSERDLEAHSRHWVGSDEQNKRLLHAIIEAHSIASASRSVGDGYLALQAMLGCWRAIMHATFNAISDPYLKELMETARASVLAAASDYTMTVSRLREEAQGRLINIVGGSAPASYPVHCLRVAEVASLIYLLSDQDAQRADSLRLLRKIIVTEEGAQHPISDRYAVSIVASVRALMAGGEATIATRYLRQVATWVLAQYAGRGGLGSIEDSEDSAVQRLFTFELRDISPPKRDASFIATALLDLCVFVGDHELFSDVENDVRANRVIPQYYQPQDSISQFFVDGDDVVCFANIQFSDSHDGQLWSYGTHLKGEPRRFRIQERFGSGPLLALTLLLRDRYFPTIWEQDFPREKSLPAPNTVDGMLNQE